VSERDDVSRPTVRRRSSAAGTSTAGAAGVTSSSCSRSAGSWKKLRRPRDLRQFRDEYGGDFPPPGDTQQKCTAARSLDDTISTTLEQLRLIQHEDCCVVRCFNTTSNGLVNRGDSFKRKNERLLHSSTDGLPGQDLIMTASRSRSQSSSNSHTSYIQQLAATNVDVDDDAGDVKPTAQSSSYTVLVLGHQGVGRTALLQQFMTSQFMAAETTIGNLSSSLFSRNSVIIRLILPPISLLSVL